LDVLFIQGRVKTTPMCDDKPTVLGEEPFSVMRNDDETGVVTYDVTTKLESMIQLNPSLEMKLLRWGKPPTKERTESATIPTAVITAMHKSASGNKLSRMPGSDAKTRSSLGTYTLTSLKH
jgi:hypothetical protein